MQIYNFDLTDFVAKCNPIIVAEIGVMAGKVSHYLLSGISSIEKFYMIDPWIEYKKIDQSDSKDKRLLLYNQEYWDDMYQRSVKVAARHGDRAVVIRKTSVDAAKNFDDNIFDIVIIDADHTYRSVLVDTLTWLPLLKDTGVIIYHDFSGGWKDAAKVVMQIFNDDDINRLNNGYAYIILNKKLKIQSIKNVNLLVGNKL